MPLGDSVKIGGSVDRVLSFSLLQRIDRQNSIKSLRENRRPIVDCLELLVNQHLIADLAF